MTEKDTSEGEKFHIPVGPQHPALKEPEHFLFTVDGERVVDVTPRIGYIHRGIEKLGESRNYIQNIYLAERICGICSHSHTTAYCTAVETLLGLEIPDRGNWIRTYVFELERIHSHLLWVGVAAHEIGFDTLFYYTWRDREHVMDMLEQISGNRVNYAINTIGGVRRDMTPEIKERAYKGLDAMEERLKYYTDVVLKEKTIAARVAGVGKITKEQAIELCAVGPNARCCGVPIDVRKDDPHAAYAEIPFKVITHDSGDTLGQVIVRVLEVFESINMCRYMLDNMPSGEIRTKAKRKVPPGETVIRVEAPRGEDIHYLKSNGTDKPERWKVRAPTLGNIPSVCERLKGGYIADIPIVLAGIDPCFSCTDRVVLVDKNSKRRINTTLTELRLNPSKVI